MKKLTKIFLAVVAGLFAFSCVQDTTEDLGHSATGTSVTVSLENSRTQLGAVADGVYPVYWSAGDQIAINGVASNALASSDEGKANATFTFANDIVRPYNVV